MNVIWPVIRDIFTIEEKLDAMDDGQLVMANEHCIQTPDLTDNKERRETKKKREEKKNRIKKFANT